MCKIYKRSELSQQTLKAWEEEANGEWVLRTALNRKELIDEIKDSFFNAEVELTDDNRVMIEGQEHGKWIQYPNGTYAHYIPGKPNSKIVTGPW